MTPMRARRPHSSRLSWGRTMGAVTTSAASAVTPSAMGGAPRVDADAVRGQADGEGVALRDSEPADHVDRKVGAEPGLAQRIADELRAEERAEKDQGGHPHLQRVR